MTETPAAITDTSEWRALVAHADEMRDVHLRTLFADDPARGESMVLEVGDLYLDYSKHRMTAETLRLLAALGPAGRRRGAARRHVRGREDQRDRAARRAPHRAAGPSRAR